MSTKKLKEVFKNVLQVTSLSNADYILSAGSDGSPKKIAKGAFLSDINDFGVNLIPGSLKYRVDSVSTFEVEAGTPVVLSMESYEPISGDAHSSFIVINRSTRDSGGDYSGVAPGNPCKLVSKGYILLYASPTGWSSNKGYFHKLKLEKGYSASKWSPAPEDFIALLGEGVSCYLLINYAIAQKGGLCNGNEKTYQYSTERKDGGCYGGQRLLHRFKQCNSSGILFCGGCYVESARGDDLRHNGIPCLISIPISSDSHFDWMYISKGWTGKQPYGTMVETTAFCSLISGKEVAA